MTVQSKMLSHVGLIGGMTAVCLSLGAQTAFAYGPEGHALVADLAQMHLTPAAEAQVKALLAFGQFTSLDQISSWADDYRDQDPTTGPFHFVDIPLAAKVYNEPRDCHYDKDNNHVADATCVVAKIPEFMKILADKSKTSEERFTALKWVVHLLGDVHQPLHAENRNDRGGNLTYITFFGQHDKLHAVWDGGVIEHQFGWKLGPNYSFDHQAVYQEAVKLNANISQQNRTAWAPQGLLQGLDTYVVKWANETHGLAPMAYKNINISSSAYQAYAWPVIKTELEKASARLAELLNEALV